MCQSDSKKDKTPFFLSTVKGKKKLKNWITEKIFQALECENENGLMEIGSIFYGRTSLRQIY
jgi:flagellar basal body-associated protein FliL